MYLGTDFMTASQFGVDSYWLLLVVTIFNVVLHYSITLQYSAYFHIYYNISRKYEKMLESEYKANKNTTVLKDWFKGIMKNPFKDEEVKVEEEENEE